MYVNGASFTMNGSSCITASPDNARGKNDVYLANGKKITGNGALYGSRYHLEIPTPIADS